MSQAVMALLLLAGSLVGQADEPVVYQRPTIRVQDIDVGLSPDGTPLRANRLMYYEIYWGHNYRRPDNRADWGNPDRDLSRLPTTYYHPHSPVGLAFQKFNWFADAPNHNTSDARIVASLVGFGGQPHSQLVALWSEPPVAVLGMNLGTEAGYARPFQTMHFFERNRDLLELSQPAKGGTPLLTYLSDARQRGAMIEAFAGEHRATFAKKGGERFYHLIVVETVKESQHQHVHVDLLTREAMQLLMSKLADDGVLCFHTSHRHLQLDKLIASVAKDLGYACLEGLDPGDRGEDRSHFSSSWVLVARQPGLVEHLKRRTAIAGYWRVPEGSQRWRWRDGEANSLAGLWRSDPYIADAARSVSWLEGQLSRLVGRRIARQLTTPLLRAPLGSLHQLVLRVRNGS